MPFSEILQLHMPNLFPVSAFEEYVNRARAVAEPGNEANHEFGRAVNLIGWRFRACIEDKEGYMASWRQYGADVSFDAIYLRERLLFGVFVSGVSCIEATIYSCYALASYPNVFNLTFDEHTRRFKSGLKQLTKELRMIDPTIMLISVLEELDNSEQWRMWKDLRNTMAHRSYLPRIIHAAIGADLPPDKVLDFAATWSTKALNGDEATFDELLYWLSGSLTKLFNAGAMLADKG